MGRRALLFVGLITVACRTSEDLPCEPGQAEVCVCGAGLSLRLCDARGTFGQCLCDRITPKSHPM